MKYRNIIEMNQDSEHSEGYQGVCSIDDAVAKHVTQLGTSACGVTALVNILLLLDIVRKEQLDSVQYDHCILRTRANDAPLPQYLYSRHHAGCTGEELVESIALLLRQNNFSPDLVEAEFFSYDQILQAYPTVLDCLTDKFTQGYVGVATMNLQLVGNDAWHHQVVFAADSAKNTVYAMNPLENIPIEYFTKFISTQSILLVRRKDVLSRLERSGGDDSVYELPNWKDFHVAQQVQAMTARHDVDFLVIPAAYQGGISFYRIRK